MYGMELRAPLSLGLQASPETAVQSWEARDTAADAIKLAQMSMKAAYDRGHQAIAFEVGEKVLLRLHKGYKVGATLPHKIGNQYAGPYTVLQRVGNLAYRLDLGPESQLHPVISVAHLEKCPQEADPYNRTQLEPGPVEVDGEKLGDKFRSYEIENLLRKEWRKEKSGRDKGKQTPWYLVNWQGYGDKHNLWYREEHLADAQELVDAYNNKHPETRDAPQQAENTKAPEPTRRPGRPRKSGAPVQRGRSNRRRPGRARKSEARVARPPPAKRGGRSTK
ncbi:hypothetical protein ASPCAL08812 [Aspergillus calidoustus]|uniref:Chromo domain-containing protein n=1 Tax=Aspergillus calidoustus TaxID=454130 RepID=A0A0U5CR36_ASPCI|nr:hypothetical protein ASPCAL08812 [Aspergillus calidoustus]